MNSIGDDTPKWLSSSPRGDIADVDLMHLLAQFFSFDAVAMAAEVAEMCKPLRLGGRGLRLQGIHVNRWVRTLCDGATLGKVKEST